MKIFISQKMRNKTHEEIVKERDTVRGRFEYELNKEFGEVDYQKVDVIPSYKPELAHKDQITSLSQSLAMLAEADIVLVPKIVINNFLGSSGLDMDGGNHYIFQLVSFIPNICKILKAVSSSS